MLTVAVWLDRTVEAEHFRAWGSSVGEIIKFGWFSRLVSGHGVGRLGGLQIRTMPSSSLIVPNLGLNA